jgi:hypothetical protein
MARFYISAVNAEAAVRRCGESQIHGRAITITGADENGEIKAFSGVVQSIEETRDAPKSRRWRVTIVDSWPAKS